MLQRNKFLFAQRLFPMLVHRSGPTFTAVLQPSATTTRPHVTPPKEYDTKITVTQHDWLHLADEKAFTICVKACTSRPALQTGYVQRRYGNKRRSSVPGHHATMAL